LMEKEIASSVFVPGRKRLGQKKIGPLEGANNKIKTMKRQSYGFRDHQFFILKIYAIHESRYALVG